MVLPDDAIEHTRSRQDFGADRFAGGADASGVDENESTNLHDDDQQHEEREDLRLQAANPQEAVQPARERRPAWSRRGDRLIAT